MDHLTTKYKINNVYNDDSYKAIKSIPDKSIDLIYTDIPYLYDANGGSGKSSKIASSIVKAQKEIDDITHGIDYSIFDDFIRVLKKINIFIWCSKNQIYDIMKYFIEEKNCFFEILVWVKTNPIPATNNVWLPDIEYCLYFRQSGVQLNDGYNIKHKWYSSPINKKDKDEYDHPTIKPIEIVKNHILHTTKENDVVADFFLGSGTTCVAAKETNRQFIGFEKSPEYYAIAKDRVNGISQRERERKDAGFINIFDVMNGDTKDE